VSKRNLVVEDQEDLRTILRDFLFASGYTVIGAVDGAESVAVSRGRKGSRLDRSGESPRSSDVALPRISFPARC
jgi:CheY-like chemotaxis protein